MFWKLWCRSFIRLIGGFILLRGALIYTYADTDAYMLTIISSVNVKTINKWSAWSVNRELSLRRVGTGIITSVTGPRLDVSYLEHVDEGGCLSPWVVLYVDFALAPQLEAQRKRYMQYLLLVAVAGTVLIAEAGVLAVTAGVVVNSFSSRGGVALSDRGARSSKQQAALHLNQDFITLCRLRACAAAGSSTKEIHAVFASSSSSRVSTNSRSRCISSKWRCCSNQFRQQPWWWCCVWPRRAQQQQ